MPEIIHRDLPSTLIITDKKTNFNKQFTFMKAGVAFINVHIATKIRTF